MTGDHSALAGVGATLVVGTAFMVPFAPSAVDAGSSASLEVWLWLVFLAFGGSLIPYLLWFWGLRYLDASEVSAYLYLVPVFALIWSLIVLGDFPPLGALAGGALVLLGVGLTQRSGPLVSPVPKEVG
jgi:probable blue pigment (indigoidine) exporter